MFFPSDLVHQNFKLNGKKFWDNYNDLDVLPKFFDHQINFKDSELNDFLKQWIHSSHIDIHSSGTTSKPRLLCMEKKYLLNSVKRTADFFELKSFDRVLHCLPIKYVAGKMQLIRALHLGLDLEMVEPTAKPLKESNDYDFVAMTSQQLALCIDKISNIKTLLVGGGLVSKEIQIKVQKVNANVYESFGMAETLSHIAIRKFGDSIGVFKVLPDVSISVDDRSCLIITAKQLGVNQLVTNDVVEILNDSQFKYIGRVDNVINSGGIKIFPEKIEEILSPSIHSPFFITSVEDKVLGQKVVLVVEQNQENISQISIQKIIKNSTISNYQKPKELIIFERFIRTPTDKIRRVQTMNQRPLATSHL